jgi:hypothetical protein
MDTFIALVVLALTRLFIPFGLLILLGTILGRRRTTYT